MKSICFVFFVLFCFSAFGQGGSTVGNGGVSVVCRNRFNKIISAELLDIVEAKEYYKYTVSPNRGLDYPLARTKFDPKLNYALEKEIALAKEKTYFIKPRRELRPTFDAFPYVQKDGCDFEQLAVYTEGGSLLVDPDIYAHLDETNRTAFYLHEAVYAIRRKFGDRTSQLARRIVIHLMADRPSRIINYLLSSFYPLRNGTYHSMQYTNSTLRLQSQFGELNFTSSKGNRILSTFSLTEHDALERIYTGLMPELNKDVFVKVLSKKEFIISTDLNELYMPVNRVKVWVNPKRMSDDDFF